MLFTLQVFTLLTVAVAMALPLAHALELPGKLRLDKEAYLTVQPIYYPGFTYGGGAGEGLGILSTGALLWFTPASSSAFSWTLAGFVALIAMHACYWLLTHPVNNFWLKDQQLKGFAKGFFAFGPGSSKSENTGGAESWKRLRNRWELSHVVRAGFAAAALLSVAVAIAL